MLQALLDRPDVDQFMAFVNAVLAQRSAELAFIVLFGSMARGDWSRGSDYDVLIGLCGDDNKRLLDRMAEFTPAVRIALDVFPYSRSEWHHMFTDRHPLLLEALEDGVVLWDQGAFATMRATFHQWRQQGQVQRWRCGWKIAPPPSVVTGVWQHSTPPQLRSSLLEHSFASDILTMGSTSP